jgi:hypothetical protein
MPSGRDFRYQARAIAFPPQEAVGFEPSEADRLIALVLTVVLNVDVFVVYGVTGVPLRSHVLGIDLSAVFSLLNVAGWTAVVLYAWRSTGACTGLPPRRSWWGLGKVRSSGIGCPTLSGASNRGWPGHWARPPAHLLHTAHGHLG